MKTLGMSENENFEDCNGSSLLELVFGTKVNAQMLSHDAVVKALDYKVEQERTKQQFYRLESVTRSIELFKLARELGVPPEHIAALFANEGPSSPLPQQQQQLLQQQLQQPQQHQEQVQPQQPQLAQAVTTAINRPPQSYKFPPAGSTLPPKPMSFPINRTHSPARIGANAVAVLNDSVALKEEGDGPGIPAVTQATPHRRSDEFDNEYDSSNDNSHHSHHSHSSHSSNNDVADGSINKAGVQHRNCSLPGSKYSSPAGNIGGTPILSITKSDRSSQKSAQGLNGGHSGGSWKKLGLVTKRHRRTKSASSFGVIDLNILEASKPSQPQSQHQQTQQPQQPRQQHSPPARSPASTTSQHRHDYDEKTCSESSSRNASPVRTNSVAKLLNSS